jgi:hypothetical protein
MIASIRREPSDAERYPMALNERTASDVPTTIIHTIVDIRGDKVRSGYDMPQCVTIHREEVQKRIDAEKP